MLFILTDSLAGGDKKKSADKSTIQPSTILADVTNIKCKAYCDGYIITFTTLDVIDPSNDCKSSAYNEG